MRLKLLGVMLLCAFFATGCTALSNIQAAEYTAAAYKQLVPGDGKMNILVTCENKNGRVVLATKKQANNTTALDLFQITGVGVAEIASGMPAAASNPVLNQVVGENEIILFGSLPNVKQSQVKAVVTFSNWQKEEYQLQANSGIVLVINLGFPAEIVKLFAEDGQLLYQYNTSDGGLHNCIFVPFQDLPKPEELSVTDILEIRLTHQPIRSEEKILTLQGEQLAEFVLAYNQCIPDLSRDSSSIMRGTQVTVIRNDGKKVEILHIAGDSITVTYSHGTQKNSYSVKSEPLAEILRVF